MTLHHNEGEDQQSKGHFEKPTAEGHAHTSQVYFLALQGLKKQSYNNRSIVSKPYLKLNVNSSALNFADLLLAHVCFHPSTTLHTDKLGHVTVTSDTGPSSFSACNIEKLGMDLGTRLVQIVVIFSQKFIYYAISNHVKNHWLYFFVEKELSDHHGRQNNVVSPKETFSVKSTQYSL